MSFLSLFPFSFLCVGAPCTCGKLARHACTACKCDCILLPVLLPIEKSNRKLGRQASPGPGFAYKSRIHWICGESYANPDVHRAAFSKFSGPGFAYQNRIHWLSGESYANPDVRPGAFLNFPGAPHPNNEETEGPRLRFLFFPIVPGCGRMPPAGRFGWPCTRHRNRCRCSPLPLHWHRS